MYRLMRKYSKKVMAVMSVFLMLTFVVQQSASRSSGRSDAVRAHVGNMEIRDNELTRAKEEWNFLEQRAIVFQQMPPQYPGLPPQTRPVPIGFLLGGPALQMISTHPDSYLLLQKEAEQSGIRISAERLESMLRNTVYTPDVQRQRYVRAIEADPHVAVNLRHAVANFMLVQAAFERATSSIKVSEPLRRRAIAEQTQSLTVRLVEFRASDYEKQVPAPTVEQLDEQFKKFADIDPDNIDLKSNPHGFTYRYPDRVKLQYIALGRAELMKTAQAAREKAAYEWEREAYKFYVANPSLYGPPSALSLDQSVRAPATNAATRPFAEAKDDARQRVLRVDADKLAQNISQRLASIMASDYEAYRKAPATQPAAAPLTSLGAPVPSYEYLQKLAALIQKSYGVLPDLMALDKDYLSAKDLAALPGIGSSLGRDSDFARYVMTHARPLVSDAQKDNPSTLGLYQPSPPFRDNLDNIYIFRITDAQKAHAPAGRAEVAAKVEADVRATAAYELALADARKFSETIKSTPSMDSAASSLGKKTITAGPFRVTQSQPILEYPLESPAKEEFARTAFDELLGLATPQTPHPRAVLSLPRGLRAVVAELSNVTAGWPANSLAYVEASADASLASDMQQIFQHSWYNYDNLTTRINYREEGTGRPSKKSEPPAVPPL